MREFDGVVCYEGLKWLVYMVVWDGKETYPIASPPVVSNSLMLVDD